MDPLWRLACRWQTPARRYRRWGHYRSTCQRQWSWWVFRRFIGYPPRSPWLPHTIAPICARIS